MTRSPDMTTPPELSEAHLQDHELISAALEASSLSPRPSSSSLPPFLTSTTERFPTDPGDNRESSGALHSPVQPSPDLLTTPRNDSSRPLASPPNLPNLSTSATNETRNTVKFTLLKKDSNLGAEERVVRSAGVEGARTDDQGERLESVSAGSHEDEERTESQNTEGESSLDPVLFAALSHQRDRFLLLRAEVELERFLASPSMTRLPLAPPYFQPALNSYQRLLVHRLADTFGITREVEAAPPTVWNAGAINPATGQPQGVVVLVKGENTRLPPAKLATYAPAPENSTPVIPSSIAVPSPSSTPSIASSPVTSAGPSASTSSLPNLVDPSSTPAQQPTAPQILKILPRSGASRTASSASSSIGTDDDPAASSSAATSSKGKGRKELTLEEREAAYKEARERIFSQPEQERSAPALPSSSSVASEDIGSRLASAGAGITRPSSAGSTFSRSSAALSVAGGRPSPSVASESGSSMWSGHHGGIYGGGSQLMPSLRHSAATFDPSAATPGGWSQDYSQPYSQDPSWQHQHQQYQPQYPHHPPIQVTAPPAHSPYSASSPPYASSSSSSISRPVPPPLQFPPPSSQPQSQYGPVDAWGRNMNIPPPLPSPSLSNSSGNSMQRPPNHQQHPSTSSATPSERSTSASSGYLMRFADTGALVTPGGTVTPGPPPPSFPSPSPSMFVGPPSTTRSVSSFSSNSQQSLSSGGTSRTAASSSAGGGESAGGSRSGTAGSSGAQVRRPSGSLASSISSVRSGERKGEIESGLGTSTDLKKRDRQTTIRRQSPSSTSEVEQRPGDIKKIEPGDESSPLHPSLPAKPVWVASKPPQPRSPQPSTASPPNEKSSGSSAVFSTLSPSNSSPYPPSTSSNIPTLQYIENNTSRPPQSPHQPYPVQTNLPQTNFYAQSAQPYPLGGAPLPQSNHHHQQQGPGSSQQWSRPTGIHYPAAPSFAPSTAGQYPIGGAGGGSYPGNPQLPPSGWSFAHSPMPPTAPSTSHPQQQAQLNSRDAMPFTDIRRPPPKSTQLFDPNRPNRGGSGNVRRGASGTGSVRSVSGTRASLE
ncbi:hypothetical protein JCM3765_000411 [Sporobolomyces pararoseus]